MSIPRARQELKEWIRRDLGEPVIQVDLADEQLDDRIDDALQFWQDYHHEAIQRYYVAHEITDDDVTNRWIPADPKIVGVANVFKNRTYAGYSKDELFNVDYQLRINDLWDLSSANISGYVIARQFMQLIDDQLNVDIQFRYKRYEGKIYIDTDWANQVVGNFLVIETYQVLDTDLYPKIFGDRVLRKLASAYARRQWGDNLGKYQEITLPGGVKLNGDRIYQKAQLEINKLESDFQNKFQEPPFFLIG